MNNDNMLFKSVFYGGLSGSIAMTAQVSGLMWLRTTMNNQYRYGGTTKNTITKLYNEGGIKRFYKGYPFAMMIGPLSRFGDTAANTLVTEKMKYSTIPLSIQTLIGSGMASSCRLALMPIDTLKTTLQVEGSNGLKILRNKFSYNGPRILFHGSLASFSATFVGHYPWFYTYNKLNQLLPIYKKNENYKNFIRNGFIGFNAAVISDCCSNSLRVIKTTKQTNKDCVNYKQTIEKIVNKDGYTGLFGRGLKTRIITNGIQGIVFTIIWKYVEKDVFNNNNK